MRTYKEVGDWKVTGRTANRVATEWTLDVGDDTYTIERVMCIDYDGPAWQAYIDGDPIGPAYEVLDGAMGEAELLIAERSYL